MKLNKPSNSKEVGQYEIKMIKEWFNFLRLNDLPALQKIIDEMELALEERYVTKEDIRNIQIMKDQGKLPTAELHLPPILFPDNNDAKSAVPYLNVNVSSWNNLNPKTLNHSLLSYLQRNK